MPNIHRAVVMAALVAAATLPCAAVAAPLSTLVAMEQLTTASDALFVAADWSPQPVSAEIGQVATGPGSRFGVFSAYLDALGMQASGGTVAYAHVDQVRSASGVAQLVQVAQVSDDLQAGSTLNAASGSSDGTGSLRFTSASVGGNIAGWSQTGNANFLRTLQFGLGNVARQDQSGSDLTSLVTQIGRGNQALIAQQGSQHLAIVYQNGQSNAVTIRQQNAQAYASVFQEGVGNAVFIRQ